MFHTTVDGIHSGRWSRPEFKWLIWESKLKITEAVCAGEKQLYALKENIGSFLHKFWQIQGGLVVCKFACLKGIAPCQKQNHLA